MTSTCPGPGSADEPYAATNFLLQFHFSSCFCPYFSFRSGIAFVVRRLFLLPPHHRIFSLGHLPRRLVDNSALVI
ncbi:hypothetical protein N7516_005508 [Penicillium verrucosum]|uniref:uncharacterized protein n=1 Tax=Penicillium verrucosum TaxID=60171 RepID=UPI002545145B|nr:uncharacterized protein N7516_005508 [Penicillium verrucosum]KAJ5945340.1 hypothetical protein N7516_005508 [Penicillium verrucosum]